MAVQQVQIASSLGLRLFPLNFPEISEASKGGESTGCSCRLKRMTNSNCEIVNCMEIQKFIQIKSENGSNGDK